VLLLLVNLFTGTGADPGIQLGGALQVPITGLGQSPQWGPELQLFLDGPLSGRLKPAEVET